ncbi:hypothetical protein K8T06_15345 [bacterium]|nr:hypothetical protein [bacterium]
MRNQQLGIKFRLWLILPALAILAISIYGCTVARMQIPESLTVNTDEMAVTGRQGFTWGKDLTFGDFTLENIKRGWVSKTTIGLLFWSKTKAHRKFQFSLKSPYRDETIDVLAVTNARMQELDFGSRSWSLNIQMDSDYLTVADCTIDEELWTVIIASNEQTGHIIEGIITNGARQIHIEATRKLQNAAFDLTEEVGYYFSENNEYLGAVENINKGAVFMKRTLDSQTRDILAIGSGVIFIYSDVLN